MRNSLKLACVSAAMLFINGCHKKPVVIAPPPQAQAPVATTPAPATTQAPVETPPSATAPVQTPPQHVPAKPKHRHMAKHTTQKPAPTEPSSEAVARPPDKVVVAHAGASSPSNANISVGMDQTEATRERQMTTELLDSTDANLKKITRTLTPDEKSMVEQIKTYMAQSRQALTDGDLGRASNLALKAHLLSDALAKH